MKLDQSVEIQLINDRGEPASIGNIVVEVHFTTNGNYRYGFKVGRTDELGSLKVTYADVERERHSNAETNLMDYNTRLEECDPTITITIPSERNLREQYDNAMRFYQAPPLWSKEWPSNSQVKRVQESFELTGHLTSVRIQTTRV
jgi:hypothetical protein